MGKGPKAQKRHVRPFVPVDKGMLQSPAWEALTNAARVVWLHLAADFNGRPEKEGHLRLTYSQAEKLMTRKTFTKALQELQDKGFIERTTVGGLFNTCSEYALVNGWRAWTPPEEKNAKGAF